MGSDSDETQVFNPPPLSILQRLDRLDRLVQFVEEKHCFCLSSATKVEDDEGKSLWSALEEAHHKGTIMERLTHLENRLIQLSLDIEMGNTSRSSCSTAAVAEKVGDNGDPNMITPKSMVAVAQRKSMWRMRFNRKWLKCLQLGCSCS